MDKRWVLTNSAGAFLRVLTPTGGGKFTEDRDLSNGCVGYRRKLADSLTFTGADYDYFLAINKQASRRCEELYVERQYMCSGNWRRHWRGSFSTGAGSWDFAHCSFVVKPEVIDKYSCFLRAQNKKVNILELPATEVSAVIWPSSIEIKLVSSAVPHPPPPFPGLDQFGYVLAATQSFTSPTLGACGGGTETVQIWWREAIVTQCIDGNPVSPPGDGWFEEVQNDLECGDEGTERWVRFPTIAWPWGANPLVAGPVYDTSTDTLPLPTSPECRNWITIDVVGCLLNDLAFGVFICAGEAEDFVQLTRGRKLEDASNYLLEKAGCDVLSIRSDFFEWNPVGDAPEYTSGINYVTGLANQMDQLFLIQKSDAIDPDATNPATKGEWTIKEMLALFSTAFRLFWDIDEDGYLRIEHWSYWTYPIGLDVTTYDAKSKTEPLSYSALKSDIPLIERARWAEAFGEDFIGADIIYSGPCVGEDQTVKEYAIQRITTDLGYVASDPTAIAKDGFVLLATIEEAGDYNVILDEGALSGSLTTNAPLSWANLHRDFWTYDRYMYTANMNGEDVTFDDIIPNKEQKEVSVRLCCDILTFDARKRVRTALGNHLGGITATVKSSEWNEKTNWVRLTLQYAY